MKLFYMPGASSLADHIALEWIGAPYEAIRMDRRSVKAPDYLALNPSGNVPLLVHDDFELTENIAILAYLADLHPAARLLGDGSPRSRAEVMRWLSFLNSDVHKAFRPIFYPERLLDEPEAVPRLASTARAQIHGHLQHIDARLKGRPWLTEARSVADAYLFVMLRWAVGAKISLHGMPDLARFARDMYRDPGVHAALVAEEGLSGTSPKPADDARQLADRVSRLSSDMYATIAAEVVGFVEYREGEGTTLEVRRGRVAIDVTRMDAVLSWTDENYRGEAALPLPNLSRYVSEGAIRLVN